MNYKDIIKQIILIKKERSEFISKFEIKYNFVYDSLIDAVNKNSINSIRVHKYLTDNKQLGKVKTARFLETIDLNENTKISQLNENNIIQIAKFTSYK